MPVAYRHSCHPCFVWQPDAPYAIDLGGNLDVTAMLPDATFRLIYLDPPFNTGRVQRRQSVSTTRTPDGARQGFGGNNYDTVKGMLSRYDDRFDDYWAFLEP